jgi:hypothetical protein
VPVIDVVVQLVSNASVVIVLVDTISSISCSTPARREPRKAATEDFFRCGPLALLAHRSDAHNQT